MAPPIVVLAGGTGGAKLARGMLDVVGSDLVVVANTADDVEVHGAYVSPDPDLITFWLADEIDRRGWGLRGDTFAVMDALRKMGEDVWFNLGDRDLAIGLRRARRLAEGARRTEVAAELAETFGIDARVLPMSDAPVRTSVTTTEGRLAFQEYFVRDKAQGEVVAVAYDGAATARPAPGVVEAIAGADLVLVCPSNPVTSIGPILAVPGIVAALGSTRAPIVGVSPIVGGAPVSGPAGRLMQARGLDVSPLGVAAAYAPWLRTLLIDARDAKLADALGEAGVKAVAADIVMTDRASEIALARRVLEAA